MGENNLNNQGSLKKALSPIGLWAIAVGLVVSGDYYGFAYGFAEGGPVSFLVSFIPVTLIYAHKGVDLKTASLCRVLPPLP